MKTIKKTIYVTFLCLSVILASCSGDDDNNDGDDDGGTGGTGGTEFLTAKVDGANFEAAQSPAVIVGATSGNGLMTFQGGTNEGKTIRGSVFNYDGAGTYTTGDNITNVNSLSYITLPNNLWNSTFDIGSGTITITSDDGTTIEGTFSFEGFNASDGTTKNITEGSFKAIIE
ncbi:MAG: hypothetical protein COB12_04705 [Flavobacterium sp.]|nr:MAG: hypothetical protein COB12_04705 [Flavobacterium sp.]